MIKIISNIQNKINELNGNTHEFVDFLFFEDNSLSSDITNCSGSDFAQIISWLYVYYNETASVNIRFLFKYKPELENHIMLINSFRTVYQHNLDPNKKEDRKKILRVQSWFLAKVDSINPSNESEWRKCIAEILTEAYSFFESINDLIQELRENENGDMICAQWQDYKNNYITIYKYEKICEEVAGRLGITLNIHEYCKKNHQKWNSKIKEIGISTITDNIIIGIIEKSLMELYLPITGDDIIRTFNIPSGKHIFILLKKAKEIYDTKPCDRNELLDQLKIYIDENSNAF